MKKRVCASPGCNEDISRKQSSAFFCSGRCQMVVWRSRNPERDRQNRRIYNRHWRENNPEKAREKSTEGVRRWRKNNPAKQAKYAKKANVKAKRARLALKICKQLKIEVSA